MTKLIATAAAARHPDAARLPQEVSTREWNAARQLAPGGDSMPLAWETARQIGGGDAIPWGDLLSALFRTSTPEQALRVLTREEPWPNLGDAEISFALLAAEQLLAPGEFLHPSAYKQKRDELLMRDRRRKDGGQLRLPTVDQILQAVDGDWRRACRMAGIESIPPEEPRPQRIRRDANHWDSREALIAEVLSYIGWLKGARSTQRKYQAYRAEHPESPSLHTLQERGGLDSLVKEAKLSDALKRARATDRAAARTETDGERMARRTAERAARPEAQRILDALEEQGLLTGPEISRNCGLTRHSTRTLLAALVAVGAVVRTHTYGAKNLRFHLPTDLTEKQRSAAAGRRAEELLRSKTGQLVSEFFRGGAEATTSETAAALGLSESQARSWIKRLLETGRIERQVVPLTKSGRSYRYRAVDSNRNS